MIVRKELRKQRIGNILSVLSLVPQHLWPAHSCIRECRSRWRTASGSPERWNERWSGQSRCADRSGL